LGILVWNSYQTFVTVSAEFWLRFEPQIRPTGLAIIFLFITVGAERKVRLCAKLFHFFRRWILIRLTWNLSRFVPNSEEILTWNFKKKTISGEFFRNFMQTKAILYQNSWNFALLSEILFRVRITLKKFRQVLSYVVCTKVRRHVHKQITRWRYGGEKPECFLFGKPVFFTLGLGLTTPYSLGILVWNSYQTFVTVSAKFWLRFEPQIRPTGLTINFLFITAGAERKVRLCAKLFHFFRGWILIRLTWNFLAFCPKFIGDSYVECQKKTISGEFFRNFIENQGYPLPKLVKFCPTFWNFIPGPYCAVKIQTSTFIWCLHQGKEARP